MDRIANSWGERTPFPRDGEWPVRVDQYLEEGVSEGDVDRWDQTASILHSNGDDLDIAVKDGRIVGVRGRGVDRVNKGHLDPIRPLRLAGQQLGGPPETAARPQRRPTRRDELGRGDG
jgi:ferredoxin-nitrate reductase